MLQGLQPAPKFGDASSDLLVSAASNVSSTALEIATISRSSALRSVRLCLTGQYNVEHSECPAPLNANSLGQNSKYSCLKSVDHLRPNSAQE